MDEEATNATPPQPHARRLRGLLRAPPALTAAFLFLPALFILVAVWASFRTHRQQREFIDRAACIAELFTLEEALAARHDGSGDARAEIERSLQRLEELADRGNLPAKRTDAVWKVAEHTRRLLERGASVDALHDQLHEVNHLGASLLADTRQDSADIARLSGMRTAILAIGCLVTVLCGLLFLRGLRQEEAIRKARGDLQAAEQKLQRILTSLDEVVWSVDASTEQIIFMNASAEKLYGRPAEEFYNTPMLWLEVVHPDDRERVATFPAELRKAGQFDMQYRIVRPDGSVRWVRDCGFVARDPQFGIVRFDGLTSDITAQHQQEERLRQYFATLRDMYAITSASQLRFEPRLTDMLALGCERLDHSAGVVASFSGGHFRALAMHMRGVDQWQAEECLPVLRGAFAAALESAEVLHAETMDPALLAEIEAAGMLSFLGVRLRVGRENWGVLAFFDFKPLMERFAALDGGVVKMMANWTESELARERAARQLQESEEQHRNIFQNTGDGIFVLDEEDRIVVANHAAFDLVGVREESISGKDFKTLLPSADVAQFNEESALARSGKRTFEITMIRATGQMIEALITATPQFGEGGLYRALFMLVHDIGERKKAERALRRDLAFARVVDELGRAMRGDLDAEGLARGVCKAVVEYCDVPASSLMYKPTGSDQLFGIASLDPPGTAPRPVADLLMPGDQSPTRFIMQTKSSLVVDAVDGDPRFPNIASSPAIKMYGIRSLVGVPVVGGGESLGVLFAHDSRPRNFSSEDVRRLEQLAIQFGAALSSARLFHIVSHKNEELERGITELHLAERQRAQFYSFLVHDLNKPLAAIIGDAGRLAKEPLEVPLARRVGRIASASQRLRNLVGRFLDFERIRRGELPVRITRFDVRFAAMEILGDLEERFPGRKALLNGESPAKAVDLPECVLRSDSDHISRILYNLIENAFKYAHTRVEVELESVDGGVEVWVWNDGKSLPEEEHERIFSEFYRRSGESGEGFGIGLASVRLLSHAVRASVRVETPATGGTRFHVVLPHLEKPEDA